MAIRANRDVLYSEETKNLLIKNLPIKREAPLHEKKYQNRGYPCLFFARGVLTVEAAFCATAFFLVLFSLLFLFRILVDQNQVQMRLATAVCQYENYGTKLGTLEGLLKNKVLINWEEKEGICYAKQVHDVPFIGSQWFQITVYQQMRIDTYEGKSMISENEVVDEYVYITENGSVYHRHKNCVYLNPGIQSVRYGELSAKRNLSGGKYTICKSCCKDVEFSDNTITYITPYGKSYHKNVNCSGLKRTIRKVSLSEIGSMPPCSKCSLD